MAQPRYACLVCATWVCVSCGWKRAQASVNYREHACAKCPSRTGTLTPTMHTEVMWRFHNGQDAQLPEGYPFGVRPPPSSDGPYGRHTAATGPEFYRGVRVPRDGPYSPLDVVSFRQGIDACLSHLAHPTDDKDVTS